MWDLTHKIGVPHRHEWFLKSRHHVTMYYTHTYDFEKKE
jgi:hypothetical protein